MVQANIDNTTVSVTLASDESVSVPAGETWRITVSPHFPEDGSLSVNGTTVAQSGHGPIETVVTDGDTIATNSGGAAGTNPAAHIGGWVV